MVNTQTNFCQALQCDISEHRYIEELKKKKQTKGIMQKAITSEEILLRMREVIYLIQTTEILLPQSFSRLLIHPFEMFMLTEHLSVK